MDATVKRARDLRRNQTDAEKALWHHLRNRGLDGYKFRRQHPVPPYFADFFCEETGLIIELDGGQHTSEKDRARTAFLESRGYEVVRFWNKDVLSNMEGVLSIIREKLKHRTHHPSPTPLTSCAAEAAQDEASLPSPIGRGEEKRVCLGIIATAHGVRGLVKVLCYGEDPEMLSGTLYTSETGPDSLTLKMKNSMGKYWLAEIEGIDDRTAAEKLRGTKLWLDRDALPSLAEEDEFYIEDLIGLTAAYENGETAGKIIAVDNFGAGNLLEIKPPQGPAYYLPFTRENVPEISLQQGKVMITKEKS